MIEVSLTTPDPATCPADFTELVAALNLLLSVDDDETSLSYVVQAGTPDVAEQDLIWFKLDGSGRPLGVFKYYNGAWRRVYNGMPSQVAMFTGDPAAYFDGTGKGIAGAEWEGWALMNGQNGTADLSDRFVIAAHMNNALAVTGYSGGWRTTIVGAPVTIGGSATRTLEAAMVPLPERPEIKVWQWEADGNAGRNGGNLYGTVSTPGTSTILQAADAGNDDPDPINIVNPFYAMAYVKFIGIS